MEDASSMIILNTTKDVGDSLRVNVLSAHLDIIWMEMEPAMKFHPYAEHGTKIVANAFCVMVDINRHREYAPSQTSSHQTHYARSLMSRPVYAVLKELILMKGVSVLK